MVFGITVCSETPLYYLRLFVSAFRSGLARIIWSVLNLRDIGQGGRIIGTDW